MWMQIVQLHTHDVIIISSVNNERVQLHTNRRVQSARENEWSADWCTSAARAELLDCLVYSQLWIMCFIQTGTGKKWPYIQSHEWDDRTPEAYRPDAVM